MSDERDTIIVSIGDIHVEVAAKENAQAMFNEVWDKTMDDIDEMHEAMRIVRGWE